MGWAGPAMQGGVSPGLDWGRGDFSQVLSTLGEKPSTVRWAHSPSLGVTSCHWYVCILQHCGFQSLRNSPGS